MKINKRYTGNEWMRNIRKRLGLSQEQMAGQLKLGPTSYKMTEQGRRTLPTNALLELIQLEVKIKAALPPDMQVEPHPEEQDSLRECRRRFYHLFTQESACRIKLSRLDTQWKMMRGLYQKTREWLNVTEQYIEESGDDAAGAERWKKQRQGALKTLSRCSLSAQVLLQSRITLLNAEAELYKNVQEQLKKELPDFFLRDESANAETSIEH
jgi:transcriptional regulator with XRE-family HTH domain